ncbi:hypothetical protein GW17_00034888 [Ensete ventricosum]|nr:hypothetical protein GW17_00034888 [Ensete ventricosum]
MGKNGLQKSLQIYLSKLKKVPSHLHTPNSPKPAAAAAASWLLSACKYPRTPSFAVDRGLPDRSGQDPSATLSDDDCFLYEKFHSLYSREDAGEDFTSESPRYDEDPPPNAFRPTERFFVSPATSNSLLRDARPSAAASASSPSCSSSCTSDPGAAVPGGGVAVMTFSKDPYDDFRRSMQDMVEARHPDPNRALDWDFMEELLFCYLELNDRKVHKDILRAFTDVIVSVRRREMALRRRAPGGNKGRWGE